MAKSNVRPTDYPTEFFEAVIDAILDRADQRDRPPSQAFYDGFWTALATMQVLSAPDHIMSRAPGPGSDDLAVAVAEEVLEQILGSTDRGKLQ